jgi:hypothetical protein
MSTGAMTERIAKASPRFKARVAGVFYLLSVLTAVSGEVFLRGKVGFAAGLIAIACYVVVTLMLYDIFKPVNRSLSLLAVFFNLVGLTFEALRLDPHGVNIALVFHGLYCLLIGYLTFRSTFLPRILGALMAFAGLAWLTNLSPSLEKYLSPYNVACGFVGVASLMLWLLVMGVNVQRWNAQASVVREADRI